MYRLIKGLARILCRSRQRTPPRSRHVRKCTVEPLESRLALSTVAAAAFPKVALDIGLFKPDGTEVTTLAAGENFVLKAFATDLRDEPLGVFSAYMDVTWDSARAAGTGPVVHHTMYSNGKRGTVTPGLVDEVGGFGGVSRLGGGRFEIFSVPLLALADGPLLFELNPADHPALEMLVHGEDDELPDEEVAYGSSFIEVGGIRPGASIVAVADTFHTLEDASDARFAPLANDVIHRGGLTSVSISAITAPNRGGALRIADDGRTLIYTPVANFHGEETFAYTARHSSGEEHSALVRVQVAEVNDPPIARFDGFGVDANSTGNVLDVLRNDSTAPDVGEKLQIIAVSSSSTGATLWHTGDHIYYTPLPGYAGSEYFTYTIRDRVTGGLTSEVHVNVWVHGLAAVDDVVTITDPVGTTVIDVLDNDTTSAAPPDTVRITSVTSPSPDVPVSIAPDGRSIVFDGLTKPHGNVELVYSITDGAGLISTAMVSLNFASFSPVSPGVAIADGVLEITGSPDDDRLVVSKSRGRLRVAGMLGQTAVNETFPARAVRKIVANLGDGDDALQVRSNVKAKLWVDAGAGNDTVSAGSGSAVLLGGAGDDVLRSGSGRDVLIGGEGRNRLISNRAHDLVIQGATPYDGDIAALEAIAAEWCSRRSQSVRRANLEHGTGPILGTLDVSLVAGLLSEAPTAGSIRPLASRGR